MLNRRLAQPPLQQSIRCGSFPLVKGAEVCDFARLFPQKRFFPFYGLRNY
jgi:hypothetical protein